MQHHAKADFWTCYHQLPKEIRDLADKNFELLKQDPRHPSLRLKKVGTKLWSARVGTNYRCLAYESSIGLVWFWIGSHADYDQRL